MKVSLICIICSMFYTIAYAHIVIDIDPTEMQRVAEILVENYLAHNLQTPPISTQSVIFSKVQKILLSIVQLFGITLSLVSANLLTSIFEPTIITPHQTMIVDKITSPSPRMCEHDFGCDRNVCWRNCDSSNAHKNSSVKSWCFTSPNTEAHDYQRCIYPHDCSPCWECVGACHTPRI